MEFGCCAADDQDIDEVDSGEIQNSLLSASDSEDSFDEQANTLDCDYHSDCTPLFKAIEKEDWKGVLVFLTTGRWGNPTFSSAYDHMHGRPAGHQARTWVTSRENDGTIQWKQLPIHAAISFQAPLPIIQKLVDLHHDGLRSGDDDGNLPLHLAFGFGSNDGTLAFLLNEYPHALSIRGLQARLPIDCCDLGSNKHRAEIIRACQEHTRGCMVRDWDRHWKRSLMDATRDVGLEKQYSARDKTLDDVFSELMEVKIELEKTKDLVKNRPKMIITKTAPLPPRPLGRKSSVTPTETPTKFTFTRTSSKMSMGHKMKKAMSSLRPSSSASVAPSVSTMAEF